MHYVTKVVKALLNYDEDQDNPEIFITVKSGRPDFCIVVAEGPVDLSVKYIGDAKVAMLDSLKV